MFRARYPYSSAGSFAALPFAAIGAVGGLLAAVLLPDGLPAPFNAALWAIIGAAAGFTVFAGEAPRRPLSVKQAVVADGVIAGIGLAASGIVIDLVIASHAGGSGGAIIRFVPAGGEVLLGMACGAVAGALLGGILLAASRDDRLARVPPRGRRSGDRRRKSR